MAATLRPSSASGIVVPAERRTSTRRAGLIGLAVLLVLNVCDVIITSHFLAAGIAEGNPIMTPVVERTWLAMLTKVGILGVLGWRMLTRKVAVGVLCFLWALVGIYGAVIMVNWMVLRIAT